MVGLFFLRKPKPPAEPTLLAPEPQLEPTFAEPAYEESLYQPLAVRRYVDETPDGLPGVPDLYAILGVDAHASDDTIRYAYRKKAARLHERRWRPDQAVRQLAELNAAYEVLGKPDRRVDYDRRRHRQSTLEQRLNGGGNGVGSGRGLPSGRRHGARRLRLATAGGLIEVAVIVTVIALALYVAATVLSTRSLVDLSRVVDIGETLGVVTRRRATATSTVVTTPAVDPSVGTPAVPPGQAEPLVPVPRAAPN